MAASPNLFVGLGISGRTSVGRLDAHPIQHGVFAGGSSFKGDVSVDDVDGDRCCAVGLCRSGSDHVEELATFQGHDLFRIGVAVVANGHGYGVCAVLDVPVEV